MGHTKGSWLAVKSTEKILDTVVDANGDSICQLHNGALNFKPDEIEANARLIAAAPDLLESSSKILEYFNAQYPWALSEPLRSIKINLEAAIAKATKTGPLENY